ncbi:MAG TPA: FixH family protein [Polyangiaceae bacterium]|nr:FixH family protein [Polyangiaceae bacterium]
MITQHPSADGHTPPPTGTLPPPAPLPARLWPWVPALLLVSLIGIQLTVLSSVLDDPTFSTEPDYYRKALDWDARQARMRQSQALGWTARAALDETAPPARAVSVSITDALGDPVSGAVVRATAFPNARAGQTRELSFREAAPGVYRAELGPARPGVWELRCSAERGAQRFESTLRLELVAGAVP